MIKKLTQWFSDAVEEVEQNEEQESAHQELALATAALMMEVARADFDRSEDEKLLMIDQLTARLNFCLLYTSPSPRDRSLSRMPSSA